MKRKQLIPAVLAGALAGAVLAGPASAGVAALTAAPSTQTFYVDGKQVDLEAYVDVYKRQDYGLLTRADGQPVQEPLPPQPGLNSMGMRCP